MRFFNRIQPRNAASELELLHGELDKQRDRFGRKEATKNTRALLLVGASALLTGTTTAALDSPLDSVPALFTLAASVLGVLAMRPSRGREVNLTKLDVAIRDQGPYRSQLILYRNKERAHRHDLRYLKRRSNLVTIGYWLVVAGVASSTIQLVLTWCSE